MTPEELATIREHITAAEFLLLEHGLPPDPITKHCTRLVVALEAEQAHCDQLTAKTYDLMLENKDLTEQLEAERVKVRPLIEALELALSVVSGCIDTVPAGADGVLLDLRTIKLQGRHAIDRATLGYALDRPLVEPVAGPEDD